MKPTARTPGSGMRPCRRAPPPRPSTPSARSSATAGELATGRDTTNNRQQAMPVIATTALQAVSAASDFRRRRRAFAGLHNAFVSKQLEELVLKRLQSIEELGDVTEGRRIGNGAGDDQPANAQRSQEKRNFRPPESRCASARFCAAASRRRAPHRPARNRPATARSIRTYRSRFPANRA